MKDIIVRGRPPEEIGNAGNGFRSFDRGNDLTAHKYRMVSRTVWVMASERAESWTEVTVNRYVDVQPHKTVDDPTGFDINLQTRNGYSEFGMEDFIEFRSQRKDHLVETMEKIKDPEAKKRFKKILRLERLSVNRPETGKWDTKSHDEIRDDFVREDLSHLFDHHEYADGIGILAISDHIDSLGILQRQLFEDCYPGNTSISRLELNDKQEGRFTGDIQWIQRRLKLPLKLCSDLRDWFQGLDLRHEDILKLINMNIGRAWEFWNEIGTIFAQMPTIKDESMISQSYVEDDESDEDEWNIEEEEIETTPREFRGIPIGLRNEDIRADTHGDWFTRFWEFKATDEFKKIYNRIPSITSNKDIAKIKKELYANPPFQGIQMTMLWEKVRLQERKAEIKSERQLRKLTDFIKQTRKDLKWIREYIFEIQREQRVDLSNGQWTIVWKTYKDRRDHEWFSSQYIPYDELYYEPL